MVFFNFCILFYYKMASCYSFFPQIFYSGKNTHTIKLMLFFFNSSHPNEREVVSCGFDLHFPMISDVEHLSCPWGHLSVFHFLIGLFGFCCPNCPSARYHDLGLISHHLVSLALGILLSAFLLSPSTGCGLGSSSTHASAFCRGCFLFEGIISLFLEEQNRARVSWHPQLARLYTCPGTACSPAAGLPAPPSQAASGACVHGPRPMLVPQRSPVASSRPLAR